MRTLLRDRLGTWLGSNRPSIPRPTLPRPSLRRPSLPRPSLRRPSLPRPSLRRPSLPSPSVPFQTGLRSASTRLGLGRLGSGYFARAYIARAAAKPPRSGGSGIDASTLALIPEEVLTHFRRNGLAPEPIGDPAGTNGPGESMRKVSLPLGLDAWVVTGYEEVRQVLGAGDAFSSDFTSFSGTPASLRRQNLGGLGVSDPPEHTRLRRILTPEFTVRRLRRLAPRIQTIVDEQLDAMEGATGPVDLMSAFAWPIPSLTICELLGVPSADRHEFQRLSTERFDLFAGVEAGFGAVSTSLSYLEDIVAEQRRSPGDGLLGMIIRTHGDEVSDQELVGLVDGVLTGGLETSASMLALGSLVLLRDPDAYSRMRDGDSGDVDPLVEELLRHLSVVQMAFPRFARRDVEIRGRQITRGDIVLCSLLRADRDEGLGKNLDVFDPERGKLPHLAFGHGIHRCIGAELARMELRAAYPALLRRFPEMRLAVPESELSFRKLSIVYGLDALPVTLR